MSVYRDWVQSNPDAASRQISELKEENAALREQNAELREKYWGLLTTEEKRMVAEKRKEAMP